MKRVNVFINWDAHEVCLTFSDPGLRKGSKTGKKAEKLYANEYRYEGAVNGFDLSINHDFHRMWK